MSVTTARILDGAAIANQIREELQSDVAAFTARAGRPPGLGIVLVGDDPASHLYVNAKIKSAAETGLHADCSQLPASASLPELLAVVERLNQSEVHNGILVQSPLPDSMGADAEQRVFDVVRPDKDVDGFHPINVGKLVQNRAPLVACTPSGVIEMLERSRDRDCRRPRRRDRPKRHRRQADGASADASKRDSDGLPLANRQFAARNVPGRHPRHGDGAGRVCDTRVRQARRGGRDVGTTQVTDRAVVERLFAPGSKRRDAFERRGSLVVGDVHPDVANVAGALSPVPGGVGPLTIALLLRNTLRAAEGRLAAK